MCLLNEPHINRFPHASCEQTKRAWRLSYERFLTPKDGWSHRELRYELSQPRRVLWKKFAICSGDLGSGQESLNERPMRSERNMRQMACVCAAHTGCSQLVDLRCAASQKKLGSALRRRLRY